MPYYNPDLIQQVLDANDIVDIISQYVPLKKRGNRFVACCPFHQEKTPSFTVNREENFYYCFGCHESGNTYTFLQKKENMSFNNVIVSCIQNSLDQMDLKQYKDIDIYNDKKLHI